jgi:hypothetical protein
VRILSNLCLIFDKIAENKNPRKGTAKLYITDEIKILSSVIDDAAIGIINGRFNNNFSKTLTEILESNFVLTLPELEKDLAIAYGIRNFGAHRIEDQPVLYSNFVELSQRLMNAIFYAVEKLY